MARAHPLPLVPGTWYPGTVENRGEEGAEHEGHGSRQPGGPVAEVKVDTLVTLINSDSLGRSQNIVSKNFLV